MKNFTLLLIVTLACTVAFGQYVQKQAEPSRDVPTFTKHSQNISYDELTKEAIWSNDFSEPTDWEMDHAVDTEDKDWVICTVETAPADLIPPYGMPDDFVSPTVDNGFALYNSDMGSSSGDPTQDAWIGIVNPIDLSTVDAPRFVFSTYFKRWADVVYFEWTTDDWTTVNQVELFHDVVQGGATASDYIYLLNVPDLGNESNVKFRFHNVGDWDYGWYIDDISIVDAPDYDLQLVSTATNFFSAVDYHEAGQEQYYHISSHYGMIPEETMTTENSFVFFNVEVMNNGMQDSTPVVDITITDPETNEAYTFNYVHDAVLASGEKDTLDIAWGDGEPYVMGADEYILGQYDIDFEVTIDGQTDAEPGNNTYSTYFEVTDYEYARDGGNLDGVCGPAIWVDGGTDGDMFAVDYTLFESTTLDSVQAYVTSNSTAGTALICNVLTWDTDTEAWNVLSASPLYTLEETDLGTWVSFTFTDVAMITVPEGESAEIKVALEFYYLGEENSLWIGEDNTIPSSVWGTTWMFEGDTEWTTITNYYNAVPMIRAYIVPTLGSAPQTFAETNINMYPNPSTGEVVISNVEGATIEIVNLMGQVVASVENAQDINNIDLSNQANGTYIVRIINGNEISTSKLNLLK
ncbi:MAG: hypothetical protein C0596_14090 [Marinilabiliales bacterium]|nr:MAG: hypothetical protein C0596_14090 [Marinilabiliales bacterium]